ncbi:MAG: NADH-quinone oxidoreductase subunit H [bacterium]|nr:NADH-quinone oxidoreductase subunit H [bacterium]
MIAHLAQIAVLLAVAPLLQGVIKSLRARLQGRPGPSPLQPYRDLRKLARKGIVLPHEVSLVFLAAPGLYAGSALVLAYLVPTIGSRAPLDAIAIALVLAFGRFALVLAALDARSSFEGMAASREATFAALGEAPLVLALVSTVLPGATSLGALFTAAAIFIVNLSEMARIPIDNQETHYELTMIHEGLALEYSGRHLALVQYAAAVRQAALLVLAAMLLPGSGGSTFAWFCALVLATAIVERTFAKLRLFEVPSLFALATLLAFFGIAVRLTGVNLW